jgi:putative aminopeptidase FrvX
MKTLLKDLCFIHAPSGSESSMKSYLVRYVKAQQEKWRIQPEIIDGPEMMDCLMLRFGKPRLAAVAHMDSVGFTVRYDNQLIPIGSPDIDEDDVLIGSDRYGPVECRVKIGNDNHVYYEFGRAIQRGTTLTYKPNYTEEDGRISGTFLDNRVGIFNLLKQAETLENGLLIFSCWEEHGGGSVPFLMKYIWDHFNIQQVLVSDVTWTSDGIILGDGVAISMRDYNIPRSRFIERIVSVAEESSTPFQLEVESTGSSDGREIQLSPYPMDWCFIGPPSERAHSSKEVIANRDLESMIILYQVLFELL